MAVNSMHFTKGNVTPLRNNVIVAVAMALLLIVSNGNTVESKGLLPILNNFMLFPRIRCIRAFLRFDFNLLYFDRYNEYFHNDSTVVLAHAGSYSGSSAIEEYVKFGFGAYSPYVDDGGPGSNKASFVEYKDGQCVYIGVFYGNYSYGPSAATDLPFPSFGVTSMVKIYFDFRERFIRRINLFYSDNFVKAFFSKVLNSVPTRQYICSVMEGSCGTILNTSNINGTSTCETMLSLLPSTTGNDGSNMASVDNYIDGNSQGCRALHAVLSESNPNNHCAHLSFTPMKDPEGNIKCQTSKYIKVSDLFTSDDIERYNEFTESVGIDPAIGHTIGL